MALTALALLAHLSLSAPLASFPMSPDQQVQLGISLALTHPQEMAKLRAEQQDPRSRQFRQWLTPVEFGARFGQSYETYHALSTWLKTSGLTVTEMPSRAFIVATGSAAQVERMLAIRFLPVEGETSAVHTFQGKPHFLSSVANAIIDISGLDTRVIHKRRLRVHGRCVGPQDLRAFYNLNPLFAAGYLGQGQKLVVLSTATTPGAGPDYDAINYFLRNVSDVQTPFLQHVIPNPGMDVDGDPGAGTEYDLDIEMQSVSVPNADSITLVVSRRRSSVFSLGVNDIVNNLPDHRRSSVSLGTCETLEAHQAGDEITAMRNGIIQGAMEGQTWFAASGDNGANDCGSGRRRLSISPPSSPR